MAEDDPNNKADKNEGENKSEKNQTKIKVRAKKNGIPCPNPDNPQQHIDKAVTVTRTKQVLRAVRRGELIEVK